MASRWAYTRYKGNNKQVQAKAKPCECATCMRKQHHLWMIGGQHSTLLRYFKSSANTHGVPVETNPVENNLLASNSCNRKVETAGVRTLPPMSWQEYAHCLNSVRFVIQKSHNKQHIAQAGNMTPHLGARDSLQFLLQGLIGLFLLRDLLM